MGVSIDNFVKRKNFLNIFFFLLFFFLMLKKSLDLNNDGFKDAQNGFRPFL